MRMSTMNRQAIVKRAIEHAFGKEEKALKDREDRLARRCYAAAIPPSVRKAAASLPGGWVRTTTNPHFNIGGLKMDFEVKEPLLVPESQRYSTIGAGIADPSIKEEALKLKTDKADLKARRDKAEAATTALVHSVTTFDKLIELWPEGAAIVKGVQKDIIVTPKLPAVPIPELNKMLGLKERKAA